MISGCDLEGRMEWLEEVLILGEGSETTALAHVCELFGVRCHRLHSTEVLARTGDADLKHKVRAALRGSRLVITLLASDAALSQTIDLVHVLRGDDSLDWDGAVIAVVRNPHEKFRLANLDLFDDAQQRFRFGQSVGHAVIARPLLIAEMLLAVAEVHELGPSQWATWRNESSGGQIARLIHLAASAHRQQNLLQALEAIGEIDRLIREIDWFVLLLDRHQDARLTDDLLAAFSLGSVGTLDDCTAYLSKVRELLARTKLRGVLC